MPEWISAVVRALLALALVVLLTPAIASAAPGRVLNTFALPSGSLAGDVATGVDGSAVVAAGANLVRLDPTTGARLSSTPIPGGTGRAVAIDSQGRIVVGGGTNVLSVSRFSASGVLDRTFSGDGTATAPGGEGRDVATGPDNSVVVVGTNGSGGTAVKFDANGNGTPFGQRNIYRGATTMANSVLVQQNGTVLVAGQDKAGISAQQVTQGYVTRFNPDGSTDTSFQGTTGSPGFYDAYGSFVAFFSLAFQDGKILVAGANGGMGPSAFFVRLLATGRLDTSFGTNGSALLPAARGEAVTEAGVRDLAVAGGDRPVGAGLFGDTVVREGGAWALEPGGVGAPFGNDTNFGFASTDIFPGLPSATGIGAARDGTLLVSGGGVLLKVEGFPGTPPVDLGPPLSPSPPPPPPPPPPTPKPRPGLGKLGTKFKLSSVGRNGIVVPAKCDRGCGLRVSILVDGRTAKRLKLTKVRLPRIGASFAIADARASLKRAGTAKVRVRLSRKARRIVLKQKELKVSLRVAAYNKTGQRVLNKGLRLVR